MIAGEPSLVGATGMSPADRLHALFPGAETHHGCYDPTGVAPSEPGRKVETKPADQRTLMAPPTIEAWRSHLDGTTSLGVCPLRADDTASWGCVDVDEYDLDHIALNREITRLDIPTLTCRSKSGGAHVFLFAAEAIPAAELRAALSAVATAIGRSGAELFPTKSDGGAENRGGWLNMPYLGGDGSTRAWIKPSGVVGTATEFAAAAKERAISRAEIAELTRRLSARGAGAGGGRARRDLEAYVVEIGAASEGGRNNLLFGRAKDLGRHVEARTLDESDVSMKLLQAATTCGLSFNEATETIRNGIAAGRREGPDSGAGRARRPRIERIVVTEGGEDIMWTVTLAELGEITLPVKEVVHYWTFQLRCAERLRVRFGSTKAEAWDAMIDEAVQVAEVRSLPPDETVAGQFQAGLRDFCLHSWRSEKIEDLLLNKPVHLRDENRIYFRFCDLQKHFETQVGGSFRGASAQRLGRLMRGIGSEGSDFGRTTKNIMGVLTSMRWVRLDLFEQQNGVAPLPPIVEPPV